MIDSLRSRRMLSSCLVPPYPLISIPTPLFLRSRRQQQSQRGRLKWRETSGRREGSETLTIRTLTEILGYTISRSDAMPSFTHFRLSHSIFQRYVPLKVPRLPEQFSRGWKVSWCRFVCFLSESASPPLTVPATSSFLFTHVHIHIDKMYARSHSRMCACVVSSIYRAK